MPTWARRFSSARRAALGALFRSQHILFSLQQLWHAQLSEHAKNAYKYQKERDRFNDHLLAKL